MKSRFATSFQGVRVALALLFMLAQTARASAQTRGDVATAADAFSRAQQAELRGDYADASELYALADQIAPAPEALRSAASAARLANMDAMAATYAAELLARDGIDAESRAIAEGILRDTRRTLARIVAECVPQCRLLVDGRLTTRNAAVSHVVYVRPGSRSVSATFEGRARVDEPAVVLNAGQQHEVEFEASDPEAETTVLIVPGSDRGISPWFLVSGATLTAVAGGLSIWSGMKVMDAHGRYDRTAPDAADAYREGRRLERRTNALSGITGGLAITSVVLAVLTDFDGEPSEQSASSRRTTGMPVVVADRDNFMLGYARAFH